jgi:hypothetical protein
VPLDISIKSNRNTIKQFYIVNLTKTWLGNFLGDFSLSLGNFFTKTSGHPASEWSLLELAPDFYTIIKIKLVRLSLSRHSYPGPNVIKLFTAVIYEFLH